MIKLLARIFIRNYKDYDNAVVRTQYGILCGIFGIFLNIVLFATKFIAGTIASSVAIVADAFNNLSDAASSLVQILGFKLASKKNDSEHPFGHGRIEYISGLIISFLILLMGVELFKSSVESFFSPKQIQASVLSIGIMAFAVLVKFYMFLYNKNIAKKINSVSMDATAKDSLSDTISTFVVIASILASPFIDFPLDGLAGIIVAIFILLTGYNSAKETISPLLGTAPSKEFVDQIEKELLLHKPIVAMHDLVVHDYGPGRRMISLHAEVPGDRNVFELHDVIDVAEVALSKKFNCSVVIHMDPIETKNERLVHLKQEIKTVVESIDPELHFHDVRMVPGPTHTNLIFDVVKPFSSTISDEDLRSKINSAIHEKENDVFCVITIDSPFV